MATNGRYMRCAECLGKADREHACREGFDEHAMAGIGRVGWSEGKGLDVARRNVAYIFACPPGERARYVAGDEGFSLFARAVEIAAADPEGPSTLAEFRLALMKT